MNTLETLQDILVKDFALDRARTTPDAPLLELGIDSLNLVDFVFKIEERFKVEFTDDMPKTLVTVGDVARYVDEVIAAQAKPVAPAATEAAATGLQ